MQKAKKFPSEMLNLICSNVVKSSPYSCDKLIHVKPYFFVLYTFVCNDIIFELHRFEV